MQTYIIAILNVVFFFQYINSDINLLVSFVMPARFVELQTSLGPIEIELYFDHAPRTCNNFYELANTGYYDGTIFHRVIKVRTISSQSSPGMRMTTHLACRIS